MLQLIANLVLLAQLVQCMGMIYSPQNVTCPLNTTFLREADGLSPEELAWLDFRTPVTQSNLQKFLKNVAKLNSSEYLSFFNNGSDPITIGLSFSGGGYRAMLCGAGQLSALDSRTPDAEKNALGGLLDSSTYLAGLSGGNWMVGSIVFNNWSSVHELIGNDEGIWNIEKPLYAPFGTNIMSNYKYWTNIIDEVKQKFENGFITCITDIWGRSLSNKFFSLSSNYGIELNWSDMRNMEAFTSGRMPFPISVSNVRFGEVDGTFINSTIIETNAYELGSWDPQMNSFMNVKYLGTNITNNVVTGESCVVSYDNAGFLIGTSSSLFSSMLDHLTADVAKIKLLWRFLKNYIESLYESYKDETIISPNPFYHSSYVNSTSIKENAHLALIDGGTDGQNVPLVPLLIPERKVDVIFAYDNSANTKQNWPNGISIYRTYLRQFSNVGKEYGFPQVPDNVTLVKEGLDKRPTFFGCNSSDLKNLRMIPPLVVFIPNTMMSFPSNTSTFQLSYSNDQRNKIITNGYEVSSRNNMTLDANWGGCVGCAIIRRHQERAGMEQSDFCSKCFQDYCWSGNNSI